MVWLCGIMILDVCNLLNFLQWLLDVPMPKSTGYYSEAYAYHFHFIQMLWPKIVRLSEHCAWLLLIGQALDILARIPLWKDGLDYRHGTGHGIGSYLNVHEGKLAIVIVEVLVRSNLYLHLIYFWQDLIILVSGHLHGMCHYKFQWL